MYKRQGYLSPYCREIRPFQRGAFLFAYDCGVPIVPFVITYREPLPLRRLLRRCPPLTLQILPPVYPDLNAPRREEIDRLMTVCRDRMAAASSPPAK